MAGDWQQLLHDKSLIEKVVLFVLGAIVGGLGKIAKGLSGLTTRWWNSREARKKAPTIIAVQDHLSPYGNFWNIGGVENKPAMQATANFKVTNQTPNDLILTRVEAKIKGATTAMLLPLVRREGTKQFGNNPIRAGHTSDLSVHLFATPVTRELGETLTADFLLCDQLGGEHWIRSVQFPSRAETPR